jgi:hypothetical protein
MVSGMGPKRFVLSVDDDTEFRSRCESRGGGLRKKSRGGGRHPRMVSLETLFRAFLDAPDRGISQTLIL